MIICHQYRFIFLKTNKTAGTSVEIALSRFCGKDDIVTHLSEEEEQLREQSGGKSSTRYHAHWTEYHLADWYRRLFQGRHKRQFYNHIPAKKLRKRIEPEIWNDYFKFCVERNPWDRVISQYFWRYKQLPENQRPSMDAFLESTHVRSLRRKGWYLYTMDGEVQVDRILRYEHLSDDLESVRQHLGLPEPIELPQTKSTYRSDRRHYREVLTDAQRDRIAEMFRDEIALMGYTY